MTQATQTSQLQLISHERILFSGNIYSVYVHTDHGPVEVLPGHAPMLCTITSGIIKITPPHRGKNHKFLIAGGVMEVVTNQVTILTTTGSSIESMSEEEIEHALRQTRQPLPVVNLSKSLAAIEANTPQQIILQEIQRSREI